MTALPITHNGQTFALVPQDSFSGRFRLHLDRSVDLYDVWDGEAEYAGTLDVEDDLGTIEVDYLSDGVAARTRYNGGYRLVEDLTEAVAYLVDEGRPCQHPSGHGIDEGRFECDDCGATYGHDNDWRIFDVRYATERNEDVRYGR